MKIVTGEQLIALFSALAAGMLALIPVYQKWREIRREQAAADHEAGIDPLPKAEADRRALVTTAQSWQTWIAPILGVVVAAVLINNGLFVRAWLEEWRRRLDKMESRVEIALKGLDHSVEQNDHIQKAVDHSVEQNDRINKEVTHSVEQNDSIYKSVERINQRHDDIQASIHRIEGRLNTARPRDTEKKKQEP